jgi:hypothetical protein
VTTTTPVPETTTTVPATATTITIVITTTLPAPGGCNPATPRGCDDGNPCTFDSCDGAFLTCLHRPLDDAPCPDDGIFCTDDRCVAGACQHLPFDLRCDRGECVILACQPGAPRADHHGCVLVKGKKKSDGAPCTDDGFSCTHDACMRGLCLHMPVDDRCVPRGLCTAATCVPSRPDRDASGCAVGPPRSEGEECAEDADVCTRDVCRAGGCAHEGEPDRAACAPVQGAFQQTIALGTLAGEIGAELARTEWPIVDDVLARLAAIEAQLEAAARALDGQPAALVAPALASVPAAVSTISAQERARIAFTTVLRTPRQVSSFLQVLAQARTRQAIGRPVAKHLRRRGRVLLRSTRMLRAELRVLQR